MTDVTARLRLVVDSTGLDKSGRKLKDLRRNTAKADAAARRLKTAFAGLAGVLGGVAFVNSIKLFNEQERAVAKVEQAVRSTGGAAGFASEELKSVARELQNVTRFGDDAILNGVNRSIVDFYKHSARRIFENTKGRSRFGDCS